ncbi:MAG TPA: hypothetical protein PLP66_07300 [Phycisphaerae bacterium]|jgi:MoxR-like ATPase|nr:hypothetical protein [Phycisphaerae bacterium]HPM23696.1 hypothetical protein [Phycisphaerae bacterium]
MRPIVSVTDIARASSGSLVKLGGRRAYYCEYDTLVSVVDAIQNRTPVHISSESGSGKTHLLNALLFEEHGANFTAVVRGLRQRPWPGLKCFRIFASEHELPRDLWYKTEVRSFTTIEVAQSILAILAEAEQQPDTLFVIWIVEAGRGVSDKIQGAWLEVIGQHPIREPRGREFELDNLTFVTDSNHVANQAGQFAIWDLDHAYGRRFLRRIHLRPLLPEQEAAILRELAPQAKDRHIEQVVNLAAAVRHRQREGALASILPPTLDLELDLLGCLQRLNKVNSRRLVFDTLLGHCSDQDLDDAESVYAQVFGVKVTSSTPAGEAVGIL